MMPLGSLNLTEQFLKSDPPLAEELSAALSVVELYIDDLRREITNLDQILDSAEIIGAGLVTAIAAAEEGSGRNPGVSFENYQLKREGLEDIFRALATESVDDRVYNPGLPVELVNEIVGACCILVEFFRQLAIEYLVVSSQSSLDGALKDLGLVGSNR